MKYNININQKAVIDLGLDLDVVDLAIFDFIKDFSNSPGCIKVLIDGKQYFWISHSKIINDLPIIKITSRQGIFKRINKLIDACLIERKEIDSQKSYYCFGVNYDSVTFVTDRQHTLTATVNENLRQPDNSSLHNYNINNYNTIDNNNTALPFSFLKNLIELGAEKILAEDWLKVRKTKKMTNTQTAFDSFENELKKSQRNINDVLKKCCSESWGGFKASWDWKENNQNNLNNGRTEFAKNR